MIGHAMKYVQMSQRVREELKDAPNTGGVEHDLAWVERNFAFAERQLVQAYSRWRELMQTAAERGSKRAAEYLKRTTWDLT